MALICLRCKNRDEIPSELKAVEQEMKQYYAEVIYCTVHKTLVVANPDVPTQTLSECEKFEG